MSLQARKDLAVNQPTAAPTNKTLAGVTAGLVAVLATFLVQHFTGIELPAGVEGAIGTFVYGVIAWLVPNAATNAAVVVVVEEDPEA